MATPYLSKMMQEDSIRHGRFEEARSEKLRAQRVEGKIICAIASVNLEDEIRKQMEATYPDKIYNKIRLTSDAEAISVFASSQIANEIKSRQNSDSMADIESDAITQLPINADVLRNFRIDRIDFLRIRVDESFGARITDIGSTNSRVLRQNKIVLEYKMQQVSRRNAELADAIRVANEKNQNVRTLIGSFEAKSQAPNEPSSVFTILTSYIVPSSLLPTVNTNNDQLVETSISKFHPKLQEGFIADVITDQRDLKITRDRENRIVKLSFSPLKLA